MLRRLLFCAIIFPALAACLACSETPEVAAQNKAAAAANEFFAACSVPGPKAREVLKMSDIYVFGRDLLFESGMAAGAQSTTLLAETSPRTYEVVIPFWCGGTDLEGKPVKLDREVHLKVRGGEVQSYELRDKELTWTMQFGYMGIVALGAPLITLILIFYIGLEDIFLRSGLPRSVTSFIFGSLTVGVVGYTAYICFGSVVVGVACGAAYTLLWVWLVRSWRRLKEEMMRPPRYY